MPAPDTDTRRLSIAEYADLQEPDDVRSELVRGVLVREPRPGAYHGRTQVRLGRLLDAYAEEHEAGLVLTDSGSSSPGIPRPCGVRTSPSTRRTERPTLFPGDSSRSLPTWPWRS